MAVTDPAAILFVAPHASYRTAPYVKAALAAQILPVIASQSRLAPVSTGEQGVFVDFSDSEQALRSIVDAARQYAVGAIIGTDDATTLLAARASAELGLAHNDCESVSYARRKDRARQRLAERNLPVPGFGGIRLDEPLEPQLAGIQYPCVVKPVSLSASRGVIRANNNDELLAACERIARLLQNESIPESEKQLALVEDFIPGLEVALEAVLTNGELQLLTIFDKPDPLEGPYFEETYYVSPSRLDPGLQQQLKRTVAAACQAYGLYHGPVHAECRINNKGIWVLEVAARTIGGLCSRLFRLGTGMDLETLVIRNALGQPLDLQQQQEAAGVMMIPVPAPGVLRRVEGVSDAVRLPFVREVIIDQREGSPMLPLPEGASYLGFIFATAPDAEKVESALRKAYNCLNIVISPHIEVAGNNPITHQAQA